MTTLTHSQYEKAIIRAAEKAASFKTRFANVFGIPRGGHYPATIVANSLGIPQIFDPTRIRKGKTLLVDDLVDSGKTRDEWKKRTGCPFLAVYVASEADADFFGAKKKPNDWIVFPDESGSGIEENAKRILQYIGEDVTREGLIETPKRMRRAWDEVFAGYKTNPHDLVKTFVQGTCKEIVILKHAEFFSYCEHHFFPFFGHCSIGYLPNKKVIGVSKLARLLDCYSRRMQIQERMTTQIADFLEKELDALGVYVVCEGVHFCMTSRGVRKQDASMITSAIRGKFIGDAAMRAEFLSLIRMRD
jgi:GTP cyclohydrolase I